MKKKPHPAVDRLLRGISTDHVETVRDAWRDILKEGASAASDVKAKLGSSAWSEYPRGPLAKYFGVLLSILSELDASAFEEEVKRLRKCKLHPMHRKTLDILSKRLFEAPATHVAENVPVFIASDIEDRSIVIKNIETWSTTKGLTLENITRIDVIPRHPELGYLGKYNLLFSGIILTWPTKTPRGVELWFNRLDAEFTFYHEVGHHVSGHIQGGQVSEQEREANEYALSMMRNSRPAFTLISRMFVWPLRPQLRRLIASSKHPRAPAT